MNGGDASTWTEIAGETGSFYFNENSGESATNPSEPSSYSVLRFERLPSEANAPLRIWHQGFSQRHQRPFWTEMMSGYKTWTDPAQVSPEDPILRLLLKGNFSLHQQNDIYLRIERERAEHRVTDPLCLTYPRLIQQLDVPHLVHRLRSESATRTPMQAPYLTVFTLPDDIPGLVTRAIQEDQILKTKLKLKTAKSTIDLDSFWEVWCLKQNFRELILSSSDPYEETWQQQKSFNYKLATTFMPGYAKSIYEFFQARRVLDPCAGWGDRLTGACISSCVEEYIAFDPNRSLRPGYTDIMKVLGHQLIECNDTMLRFSNGFQHHALPFEVGAAQLFNSEGFSGYFDLVFTSPPFFDYEMYSDANPKYSSWLDEFYVPMFQHCARLVKRGGFVCIHIDDTSAGNIREFLQKDVGKFCPQLQIQELCIGLRGLKSDKIRPIWLFKRI
jgi:hypothetical protein